MRRFKTAIYAAEINDKLKFVGHPLCKIEIQRYHQCSVIELLKHHRQAEV